MSAARPPKGSAVDQPGAALLDLDALAYACAVHNALPNGTPDRDVVILTLAAYLAWPRSRASTNPPLET